MHLRVHIKDINEVGVSATIDDLGSADDIERATMFRRPPERFPRGSVDVSIDFTEPGQYIGIMTAIDDDADVRREYVSVFPFSVGVTNWWAQLKWIVAALLLGVVVGLHWVTYFAGMQMAGITVGIIAFFTYPVITVFLEPLFTKQAIKLKDIISGLVVLVGIYLLVPQASLGNDVTLGIITGVVSGAFFALRNLLQKQYFSQYSGPHTMLYQTLIACVMLCVFVEVPPSQLSLTNIQLILLAGVIFTAVPHALFSSSLQGLSATTVGLISCLQPLYGTVLAVLLLAESPNVMTLIGGLLVLSAACFETWSITRKKS